MADKNKTSYSKAKLLNNRKKVIKTETTEFSLKEKITTKRSWLKTSYIIAVTSYINSSKKSDRDAALKIKAKLDLCNELLK